MLQIPINETKYKRITKTDPRIRHVLDFIQRKNPVILHTIDDMYEEIQKTITEYYHEVYAQALAENNGKEPKNVKIAMCEYVLLLNHIIPLARVITPSKESICLYDFDENSPTYGQYIKNRPLIRRLIAHACPYKRTYFYDEIYRTMILSIPVKNDS